MKPQDNQQHFEKPDFWPVLVASGIFLFALFLLFYAERGTVHMKKASAYMMSNFVQLTDTSKLLPENDNKMVYFKAYEQTDEEIFDSLYGVGGRYLSIVRFVEYYQWIEIATTEKIKYGKEVEERTEYSYSKGWSKTPVNSNEFYDKKFHENIAPLVIKSKKTAAKNIKMGPYYLGDYIRKKVADMTSKTLNHGLDMAAAQKPLENSSVKLKVHLLSKEIYYGNDPASPEIGDVRVSFKIAVPDTMYILAKTEKDKLEPHYVSALDEHIFHLSSEEFDPNYYLKYDEEGADWLVIVIRVIFWLLIVWATHYLKGYVVSPMRRMPLIKKILPKEDNKLTLWAAGTYLSIAFMIISYFVARM